MSGRLRSLVAFTTHARDVSARDRAGFGERARERFGPAALVLETCHRVEAYVAADVDDHEDGTIEAPVPPGGRVIRGEAAARHAIEVAVGLDSVVEGEDQILHQLREAVALARSDGPLDPLLERLFAAALRAGRQARSWRGVRPRSLADVALDAVARRRGTLDDLDLLVVGAGRMGRLVAQASTAAGARVAIANRSEDAARILAEATGARRSAFDPGVQARDLGAVVVALAGPWTIGSETVAELLAGDAVVVDLSVPAAVPVAVVEAIGDRFVSADALAREGTVGRPARASARVDALIERTLLDVYSWVDGADARAAAAALTARADEARAAELAELWRRHPDVDVATRAAIEAMASHLAGRLLREPLERLGRDRDGSTADAVREVFAL